MRKWLAIFPSDSCGEWGCESGERVFGLYAQNITEALNLAWDHRRPGYLDGDTYGGTNYHLIDLGPSQKRIARIVDWHELVTWSEYRVAETPEWALEA